MLSPGDDHPALALHSYACAAIGKLLTDSVVAARPHRGPRRRSAGGVGHRGVVEVELRGAAALSGDVDERAVWTQSHATRSVDDAWRDTCVCGSPQLCTIG